MVEAGVSRVFFNYVSKFNFFLGGGGGVGG